MHGRPRKALKPEEEAAFSAKAEKLRILQSQVLQNHHNKIYNNEALELSEKLVTTNPEMYTAWNYRKLAVDHSLNQLQSDPDAVKSILDQELRVVEDALKRNFKCYGAWHHRKWVLSKSHSSLDKELRLLNQLHKLDSRNFHAWNYRRFVTASMNRSDLDELKYSKEMIENNFSNYSAWHNRSVLLSNLLEKKVEGFLSKEQVLPNEYDDIHHAIYTDPDDQSGWFYHLWLLDQTVKNASPHLVSSWPAHHSVLRIIHSDMSQFAVILYFNQAVEGLNSTTVTIKCANIINEDLIWKPLSANSSQTAQAWITHLKFQDLPIQPAEAIAVEVDIGHSEGIISSSCIRYAHQSQFTFRVCAEPVEVKSIDVQSEDIVSWKDENFEIDESNLDKLSIEFDKLSIKNDSWQATAIAGEWFFFCSKFGKLTLARLLKAHDTMIFPGGNKAVHSDEILELHRELMNLDTTHYQLYKDEHSLALLQQVITNKGSFLKHCFHYKGLNSSITGFPTCVRLNNLSLSRMGSFEKLLWVQMLDLSHNELRSIEGLEALQLVSCLNLSHNQIRSFTALEALRHMKSLKVLDISYNEIGNHTIDTTRYLCSSPLSHSIGNEWKHDESIDAKYWESYFIFKDMNLVQLDVTGNAIAEDGNFKLFLIKVLPCLNWLDGDKVL
ncbi:hypothetical protein ACFE04_031421 [Oxalis oulophora]